MTSISAPSPHVVVLTGFMGTGKSEVGRVLAELLGVEFIDTDALIESDSGMTVSEIFALKGETRFRRLETEVIADLRPVRGAVIATGGGVLTNGDNLRRLSRLGTVVLLEASVDAVVERLKGDDTRPLLKASGAGRDEDDTRPLPKVAETGREDARHDGSVPNTELRERIESLLRKRQPFYDAIAFRADTTDRSAGETATEIALRLGPGRRVIRMAVDVRPRPSSNTADECRIVVGRGAVSMLGPYLDELGLRSRAFLIVPEHLREKLLDRVTPSLDAMSIPHEAIPITDGDANKNFNQVSAMLDALAAAGARRDSVVVSVGGGVTCDIAGFVASIYMRGIPFAQVPTTLVSQVDAGIGGKSGVNHARAKNLIGSFYQPMFVLSDPLMLDGLPAREISNGMAEVVKTAIIGSPELYDYIYSVLDESTEKIFADPMFLERCSFECARVKSEIVEKDPYDVDLRRVLNLGHTLGHALESTLGYGRVEHGEAVALGTIAAIRVAVTRGRADQEFLERSVAILGWCGLPTVTPPTDRESIRRALGLDKKAKSVGLFFVLPVGVGDIEIVDDVTEDELIAAL